MTVHHELRAAAGNTGGGGAGIPVTSDLRIHWDFNNATAATYTGSGTLAFANNIPGAGLSASNGGGCLYHNRSSTTSTVDILYDSTLQVNYAKIYTASSSASKGTCLSTEQGALNHNVSGNLRSGFTYITAFKKAQGWSGWHSPLHWEIVASNVASPTTTSYRYTGYMHLSLSSSTTPLIRIRNTNYRAFGAGNNGHRLNLNNPVNTMMIFGYSAYEDPSNSNNLIQVYKTYMSGSATIFTSSYTDTSQASSMDLYTTSTGAQRQAILGDNMYWNGGPEWHWYEHAYYDKYKTASEMDQVINYMANKFI